jgi:hypothetical protein
MKSLLALILTTLITQATAADRPPNIVFFLADDLGQRDLACYGSTFHETPNLDRLAREGARFTQAYAACPVCSPSRASILTGQWPQRTGITDYIGAPLKPENWNRNTPSLPAPYTDRLPLESITLAESLKAAGYATFFAGNGSVAIHDYEIARWGGTSEDVDAGLEEGSFGMAEETGREMNEAIRVGAGRGMGMGEALDNPNLLHVLRFREVGHTSHYVYTLSPLQLEQEIRVRKPVLRFNRAAWALYDPAISQGPAPPETPAPR